MGEVEYTRSFGPIKTDEQDKEFSFTDVQKRELIEFAETLGED